MPDDFTNLEAVRAELARMENRAILAEAHEEVVEAENTRLRARIEELEVKAERYDWLSNNDPRATWQAERELAVAVARVEELEGERNYERENRLILLENHGRVHAENTRLGKLLSATIDESNGYRAALERVRTCSSILTAKGLADQALAPSRETE